MKVLHVIDSEGFYGAETVLVDLACEQQQQGIRSVIINMRPCPEQEYSIEAAARSRGVNFHVIPVQTGLDFRGAWQIARYALDNQFDIIHCHGYKADILMGLIPKRLRKLPLIITLHGWCSRKKFTKLWLFEQLDRFALNFADAVVVVNKAMLVHPFLQNSRLNIKVVNNGIPVIDFVSPALLDEDIVRFCRREGIILGAIGRLSKEKGFYFLLQALQALCAKGMDPHLVIIGEGEDHGKLESLAKELKIEERVLFAGYRSDAKYYLPLFDLFVMPSLTEGLPVTLLEAMQAKIPIVASSVGGIPEVLKGGHAGILVPPSNTELLVEAILKFIKDYELKNKLVGTAYREVKTIYSNKVMAEKYYEVYEGILM